MVCQWSPDPPHNHCNSEIGPVGSSSFTFVGGSSSDSETEEISNHGYELLPMTPMEDVEADSDSESEENDIISQTVIQPSETLESDTDESNKNLTEMSCPQPCDTEDAELDSECNRDMDPELMDKIRAAMSGFSLPLTAVPSWAFHVPEEEWHSHLVERMQDIQQRSSRPPQANHNNTNVTPK